MLAAFGSVSNVDASSPYVSLPDEKAELLIDPLIVFVRFLWVLLRE